MNDGIYIINLDEYKSIGSHWIALYVSGDNVTYCDTFGVDHIPKEIKNFIRIKIIMKNIYKIKEYNSVMCRYFCIGFIDFIVKSTSMLNYTNLSSSKEYKKNHKIVLKYFQ